MRVKPEAQRADPKPMKNHSYFLRPSQGTSNFGPTGFQDCNGTRTCLCLPYTLFLNKSVCSGYPMLPHYSTFLWVEKRFMEGKELQELYWRNYTWGPSSTTECDFIWWGCKLWPDAIHWVRLWGIWEGRWVYFAYARNRSYWGRNEDYNKEPLKESQTIPAFFFF